MGDSKIKTPAEMLRRTAKLMRERVEPLPPSPWRAEGRDVTATQDYEDDGSWDWDRGYVIAACPRQDEAEHIAAWSPPVTLAVAEWLEGCARDAGFAEAYESNESLIAAFCNEPGSVQAALKVARLYLGETPSTPIVATGGKDSDKEDGRDD